ncbi:hypothetical protein MRB53_013396 [Persea americana]|uniref:Uncharacterized protein n=1 Tax=Persea americana TaxID=3435 RepID=A0ACC2K7Z6_PERAE|nr:hypothetical protein MRB53_013396 [Persea americana]
MADFMPLQVKPILEINDNPQKWQHQSKGMWKDDQNCSRRPCRGRRPMTIVSGLKLALDRTATPGPF